MELTKFQIENFRSINDSGEVTVAKLTSLVGRNESGKSNLLLALATLNPAGGPNPLNKIKDFPRGRRLEECKDDTPVVTTHWKLSSAETDALKETLRGYVATITKVSIGRGYAPTPWVDLGVTRPGLDGDKLKSVLGRLETALMPLIAALNDPQKTTSETAWRRVAATVEEIDDPNAWAAEAVTAADRLRAQLGEGGSR
jgi:AAA ATPase domain